MKSEEYPIERLNENTYCIVQDGIIKEVGSLSYIYKKMGKYKRKK